MGIDKHILSIKNEDGFRTKIILLSIILTYSTLLFSKPAFTGPVFLDPALRHYILLGDLDNLLHNVVYLELAPPGWHIISYVLIRLSPLDVILTLNVFNAVLISGAIISAYLCISYIYTRNLGLLAAFLVPANYTFLDYAIRADHYILFATTAIFITTAAVYATSSTSIQGGTNGQLITYSLLIFVSGFTHYYSGILIAAVGLVGLQIRWSNSQALFRWLLAHIPLCLGYIFWLPNFYFQYQLYSQRFGTGGGGLLVFGPAESITPINIFRFFPDNVIIFTCLVFLTLLIASVVLIGSIATIDPQKRVIISAVFGTVFGILLVDFGIGSGGGRYALQAATLVPLGVIVGIKQLYILNDKTNKNLKNILISIVVLVALFYSGGILQYGLSGGDISADGEEYVKAANDIDNHVETTPEQTVVLSTLHAGEGVLKYYSTGSYEVHGIPRDAFNQHRMTIPIHTNQIYNENNSTHQQRLDQLVTNKKYVIVFLAHADTRNRYDPVRDALVSRGFTLVEKSGSKGAGYVIFQKAR
jgi:hypothetical protein